MPLARRLSCQTRKVMFGVHVCAHIIFLRVRGHRVSCAGCLARSFASDQSRRRILRLVSCGKVRDPNGWRHRGAGACVW